MQLQMVTVGVGSAHVQESVFSHPFTLLRCGIERNLERLGFQPDVYSTNFRLVDQATVAYCRDKGITIIPWTINDVADMEAMKKLNLDGIVTDYPDRAVRIFGTAGRKL